MVEQIVIKLGGQLILSRRGKKSSLSGDGFPWGNQAVEELYTLRQVVD